MGRIRSILKKIKEELTEIAPLIIGILSIITSLLISIKELMEAIE